MNSPRLARLWALATFEVRQQLREPLTALYALVFLLLAFGYSSSGAVELVGARGTVAKTSDWAIWLAFGGLTGFGQVITTMVVVTAVLRDSALRVDGLIATTALSTHEWLLARLTAALLVLLLCYVAMPLGLWLGTWVVPTVSVSTAGNDAVWWRIGRAYVELTVSTMLVVASVVGVTAALTKRPLFALASALGLLALWQISLALVARPDTQWIGAMLDPFGNAPVLATTRLWTVAERQTQAVPWVGAVADNRLLWLSIALGVGALGVWRVQWGTSSRRSETTPSDARRTRVTVGVSNAFSRFRFFARRGPARAIAQFTAHWIMRDTAWRVVTALAVVNALGNAVARAPDGANLVAMLSLVREHARLFLILLATVYAGEIVWRERDTRVAELVDAVPVRSSTMARARVAGLLLAQSAIALALAIGTLALMVWRLPSLRLTDLATWSTWSVWHVWAPLVEWSVLAVAVHVVIRHKVGAHFAIITGWVAAVVLDRHGAHAWWYRYAEPAPLIEGSGFGDTALFVRGVYWLFVSLVLVRLIIQRWPRGTTWGTAALTSRR